MQGRARGEQWTGERGGERKEDSVCVFLCALCAVLRPVRQQEERHGRS